MDLDRFRVSPGRRVDLSRVPTDRTAGVRGKEEGRVLLQENVVELAQQQARLYAQDQYALLIVFQAPDAAGKDSTIKHVMSGVNPQGVDVTSFKSPTSHELEHDYLWRSVVALPERGMIGIHNRSHYEEVIVVRVHPEFIERQRLPDVSAGRSLWEQRYRQINDFERHLVENGTVILKFFLHVSRQEQRERLLDRIESRDENWKFSLGDVRERALWKKYRAAYEDMLQATSTERAPWFIIPADRKWYMQLVVGRIIVKTLRALKLDIPALNETRRKELAEGRRLLMKR